MRAKLDDRDRKELERMWSEIRRDEHEVDNSASYCNHTQHTSEGSTKDRHNCWETRGGRGGRRFTSGREEE